MRNGCKVLVDAMPKAQTWRPEAALASGMENCDRKRAGKGILA